MVISGDYWTKKVGVALKEASSPCLASAGDEQLEATLAVSTGGRTEHFTTAWGWKKIIRAFLT